MSLGETHDQTAPAFAQKPFVFLSSFTQEFGGWLPDGSLDKTSLRYKAFLVGEDVGRTVWVAEVFRPDLKPPKAQIEIVDTLWDKVRSCDILICLLGGVGGRASYWTEACSSLGGFAGIDGETRQRRLPG